MKDISCHILDIVNNSVHAGAKVIEVNITKNGITGAFILQISDNGTGIPEEMLTKVTDPFITSSKLKKVGLGLPLLKQNAELTGGSLRIHSDSYKGTEVWAIFDSKHIDMIPEGDIALSVKTIISAHPGIELKFRYRENEEEFSMDTRDIKNELGNVKINAAEVLEFIRAMITENIVALKQITLTDKHKTDLIYSNLR